MKVAIIHDDFIQYGGAEQLVLALWEIWPNAVLYTSYVTNDWAKILKEKNIEYKTSFMQKLPYKKKLNKYYAGLMLYPLAFESFDFTGFDLVISSSSRFAHCIVTKPSTLHISYINSPGRMFWEFWDYFENFSFSRRNIIKRLYINLLKAVASYYRTWDYYSSFRADYLIANSSIPHNRIKKFYDKESTIIYPFVNTKYFENKPKSKANFFLIITRLVSWKKVDIAIDAFIKNGQNLRIIGDGPELQPLKAKAAGYKNIELLGYVSDDVKIDLLCSCCALINTQLEDFGIAPLEAMAAGKPVLAYGRGGALETVIEGKTGAFYYEQTPQALNAALETFDPESYLVTDCVYQARRFDKDVFLSKIKAFVDSVYLGS